MNYGIREEYERLRKLGYTAHDALRDARVSETFDTAADSGVVKFEVVYDHEMYDDSYLDTWPDMHERKREHLRKELWERIERDGVYGIRVHALNPYTNQLDEVDSVWSFVGDDWKDSGYDTDLKRTALEYLQGWML